MKDIFPFLDEGAAEFLVAKDIVSKDELLVHSKSSLLAMGLHKQLVDHIVEGLAAIGEALQTQVNGQVSAGRPRFPSGDYPTVGSGRREIVQAEEVDEPEVVIEVTPVDSLEAMLADVELGPEFDLALDQAFGPSAGRPIIGGDPEDEDDFVHESWPGDDDWPEDDSWPEADFPGLAELEAELGLDPEPSSKPRPQAVLGIPFFGGKPGE